MVGASLYIENQANGYRPPRPIKIADTFFNPAFMSVNIRRMMRPMENAAIPVA